MTDWFEQSYENRLVRHSGKVWFVKSKPKKPLERERDRLGYLLARRHANAAQVLRLSPGEFRRLIDLNVSLPQGANSDNTYLVRFGPDHELRELPNRTLDQAVAYELAYSLWIRRRDAHSYNRVYVKGVPVFFDHQTGFLGEPELEDPDCYFCAGKDAGYAGRLRVEKVPFFTQPETLAIRLREKRAFAKESGSAKVMLPIRLRAGFERHLNQAARWIRSIPEIYIRLCVKQAGFNSSESEKIISFLLNNQNTFDENLTRLRQVMYGSSRHY